MQYYRQGSAHSNVCATIGCVSCSVCVITRIIQTRQPTQRLRHNAHAADTHTCVPHTPFVPLYSVDWDEETTAHDTVFKTGIAVVTTPEAMVTSL